MAKFCSKCGKPLVDGVPCDCEKQEVKEETEKVQTENKSASDVKQIGINIVDQVYKTIKKIFKKPVDTIKNDAKEGNVKKAWILVIINSVVFGLAFYFVLNNLINSVVMTANTLISAINTLSSFAGDSVGASNIEMKLPFIRVFLCLAISMFIGNLILVIIQKIVSGLIFRGKGKVKDFFIVHSSASVINTISIIIAAILTIVSVKISLIIIALGIVFYFVNITQAYIDIMEIKSSKLGFATSLSIILGYVVSIFVTLVIISVFVFSYFANMASNSFMNMPSSSSSSLTDILNDF